MDTNKIVKYEDFDSYTIMKVLSYSFGHSEISQIKNSSQKKIEETNYNDIIVDITDVDFIDSSVIGYIVNLKKILEKHNSKITIVCKNANILKIMNMINFQKIIKIFAELDEAKDYVNKK